MKKIQKNLCNTLFCGRYRVNKNIQPCAQGHKLKKNSKRRKRFNKHIVNSSIFLIQ